jgi:alpha 1,2-mannosyltransferase
VLYGFYIDITNTIKSRFNRKYQYPYVFLNDEEFSDEFKESIKSLTSAKVTFGDINEEMWSYPEFVDQTVAADQLMDYQARGVMYGRSHCHLRLGRTS